MAIVEAVRRGIVNQGAFFSPYYLFDLLGRQHADEIDPHGREVNRRLLRQVFRRARLKYGESGSKPAEAWDSWLRELFEALGFGLQLLPAPLETAHHGLVPIARAAYAPDVPPGDADPPLVLVDVHGFGADFDRDHYPQAGRNTPDGHVTEETIARAVEFALDANETRWAIVAAGDRLRLYRKGGSVARQYLEVNLPALFDADRADEWTAFWGLFRLQAFLPDPANGKCLLDRVLEESQRHAARIADDLRENVVTAVEALIQGVLDDPANRELRTAVLHNPAQLQALFEEALYFLYRLLFVLYAESRDLLPISVSIYRDAYSLEHLRDLAERPLHAEDAEKTYYIQTLRTLFAMLHHGFPAPAAALKAPFNIPAYDGQLFDPQRTRMIDQCRIPDRAMQQVIAELSLSRPRRRNDRRERYSYADLGVDQLGSIYEGLLVYEPAILDEETVVAKVKGEERLISRAQAEEYQLSYDEYSLRRRGSFVLRLWGGRRKGSGSYYTPQEITAFLVQEALGPLVEEILAGVRRKDVRRKDVKRKGVMREEGMSLDEQDESGEEALRFTSYALRDNSFQTDEPDADASRLTSHALRDDSSPTDEPDADASRLTSYALRDDSSPTDESPPDQNSRATPEDILQIKVCDPAMGSGAFLIQACRYLAEAYGRARIAAGLDDDGRMSQLEFARYKRRVAETCLYGVDLNPMAVELAKVSLWLETMAGDRPLTFLDAHLRCGNSLIGAPLRDADGAFTVSRLVMVPDEALKEVSKEATAAEKAAARERVKQNRAERQRQESLKSGQLPLAGDWGVFFLQEIERALTETLSQRLDLEQSDDDLPMPDAVKLVHSKEQRFRSLLYGAGSRYRQMRQICDLWCACWFWPALDSEITVRYWDADGSEHQDTVRVPEPPTTQVLLELAGIILGTDPGSLSDEQRQAYLATTRYVWLQQRFFHWELEFPEIWREAGGKARTNGGFDAVVGNPPWETIKPNSQEFWSNYNPLFREMGKQEALHFADELRADAAIDAEWRAYERGIVQFGQYLRQGEQYRNQGGGDINTYKLFLEQSYQLLRNSGGLGMVLPSGLNTDLGAQELRQLLFTSCRVRWLLTFNNERFIFPAVHHSFRFVLLMAQRGGTTEKVRVVYRLTVQNAVRPDELTTLLANLEAVTLSIPLTAIRRFSPDSLSLMEFKSQREIDVATKIYSSHPLLGEEVPNTWNARFTTEFHMTNDSRLFRSRDWLEGRGYIEQADLTWCGEDGERYLPLYEGKMVHQYDAHFAEPRYWVNELEARKSLSLEPLAKGSYQAYRLSYRLIARSTDEMTLVASVLPHNVFAGNSIATIVNPDYQLISIAEQFFVYSVMCSFTVNAILRQKVSANLNMFIVAQLPLPRLTKGNRHFDALVIRAAILTCTTPEFDALWEEVVAEYPGVVGEIVRREDVRREDVRREDVRREGVRRDDVRRDDVRREGVRREDVRREDVRREDVRCEGGETGDGDENYALRFTPHASRSHLRAEIDALVADLYGLSEADFAYILSTFPILDRDWPALPGEPKSFITRDQALLALFTLRGSAPPEDIVPFFADAGVDISAITGPVRSLAERVAQAQALGAVAYVPSGRGGGEE